MSVGPPFTVITIAVPIINAMAPVIYPGAQGSFGQTSDETQLEHYYYPWHLENAIKQFAHYYYNNERYHESLDNIHWLRCSSVVIHEIMDRRATIKVETLQQRRIENLGHCVIQ